MTGRGNTRVPCRAWSSSHAPETVRVAAAGAEQVGAFGGHEVRDRVAEELAGDTNRDGAEAGHLAEFVALHFGAALIAVADGAALRANT